MKILPKKFFDTKPKLDSYIDSVGYCVNCGKLNTKENLGFGIDPKSFVVLITHGYVRLVDIKCRCGSSKGIHDMDVENYRAWDISK